MTLYLVIDDIEAHAPNAWRKKFRDRLPSTVPIFHGIGENKGAIQLSPAWMQFVRDINDEAGRKYQFVNNTNNTVFRDSVGWHNVGAPNLVEQVTFSGNIVDVISIEENRAYIRCFYNNENPPAVVQPMPGSLHPVVQLFTTQYEDHLDMTTMGKYPRTFLIANDRSEKLWIDIRNLRKVEEKPMDLVNGIPMEKGNDISKYNEVIDWPALKAAGHRYTIIRSGQGPSYKDPYFAIHRNNAIANGLPWGVYHFFDYRWPDGQSHFQNMQSVVGKNFGNIAPSVDLETLYNYFPATKKKPAHSTPVPISCGRNTVYNELMEFGALLWHETGSKPMLYVGNLLSWLKPDQAFMDLYDLWFAYWNQIPGKTTPFIDWTCWQRMGDVTLPGQRGVWDIDYVKQKDWNYFIGSEDPEMPLPEELSLEEKVERMWAAFTETQT